ncbi:hypothetical protein C8R46DRAFT_1110894 [Mycena filopes]|nr:hypothetical protein C8R46DRAFT_1110894 [Mycena filopes]
MVQGPVPPEITPPLPSSPIPPPSGLSSAVSATLSPTTPRTRIRMAPMSPTYDRLEAGRPPLKPSKRFAWKKFAMGAGILLVLVWLFVPKEKRQISMPGWGGSSEFEKGNTPYEGKPTSPIDDGGFDLERWSSSSTQNPRRHVLQTPCASGHGGHCIVSHSLQIRIVEFMLIS